MDVRIKRAYGPAEPADGYRVLIDRLWPRGVSRERAKLDGWEKELSPSVEPAWRMTATISSTRGGSAG